MAVINPAFTQTITPSRPVENFGEEAFTSLPSTPAVVSLSAPSHKGGTQSRFVIYGTVFVPRGYDLKSNDRFTYQNFVFRVTGWPRGDQPQAFTGDDFGWVSFMIEAAP